MDNQKNNSFFIIIFVLIVLFSLTWIMMYKINKVNDSHLKLIYDEVKVKQNVTLDLFDTYAINNRTGLKCDERYLIACDNTDKKIYLEFLGYTCYAKGVTCERS